MPTTTFRNRTDTCRLQLTCEADSPSHNAAVLCLGDILRASEDRAEFEAQLLQRLRELRRLVEAPDAEGDTPEAKAQSEAALHRQLDAVFSMRELRLQWDGQGDPLPMAEALPDYGLFVLELLFKPRREPIASLPLDF